MFISLFLFSMTILGIGKFLPENDFNIKSVCWMFQFYVAGAAFKEYGRYFKNLKVLGPLLVALFVISVWSRYEFISQESLLTYVVMMMMAYLGCLSFFLFYLAYGEVKTLLVYIGQSTLGIYAIHQTLIKIMGINNVWLSFIVVLALSLIFVIVIRWSKYFKFVIGE